MLCLLIPILIYLWEIYILYFQDRSAYSAAGKYVDRSWEYINRSQTQECGNLDWGRAIPRKGIHKWDFRRSVESFIEKLWAQFSDCPCTNNSLDLGDDCGRGAEGVEVHCVQEDWRLHCLQVHSLNHRVHRVPGFLSRSPNWVPHPFTRKRVGLPPSGPRGETHSLAGERVGWHCVLCKCVQTKNWWYLPVAKRYSKEEKDVKIISSSVFYNLELMCAKWGCIN